MDAEAIVKKAMKIAGDICVYTNHNLIVEIVNPVVAAAGVVTTMLPLV